MAYIPDPMSLENHINPNLQNLGHQSVIENPATHSDDDFHTRRRKHISEKVSKWAEDCQRAGCDQWTSLEHELMPESVWLDTIKQAYGWPATPIVQHKATPSPS